jgi:hypothetical protein
MEAVERELAVARISQVGQALADNISPNQVHIMSDKKGKRLEIRVNGRYLVSMESDSQVETADAIYGWVHKLLTGRT